MSKSKLTLLVDGNWLLMSRLAVLNTVGTDDYELCNDLKLLMIRSINVVLRKFPMIDNVIICSDGGSWRNNVEIPKCLQREEQTGVIVDYKGTRVRSTDINWELIFNSYNDLIELFKQFGITASKEKDIEGDDWIYHWSTYLNSLGTNCIIWTKDNDLKQLIKINSDKCFTGWWNKDSGLFLPEYSDDDMDFMFNISFNANEQLLQSVINASKQVSNINPKNIIIDKILKGDMSDNILPVILRKSKGKSNRKFKISSKDIDYDLDYWDDNKVLTYLTNILISKNYVNRTEHTIDETFEHFRYNRKLIVLDKRNMPDYVMKIFNENKDYFISTNVKLVEENLIAQSNNLNGILNII